MIRIYSHIFKFETSDLKDKVNNNIISIVEEDSKKHYINYIQYHFNDDGTVSTREANIKVDRLYYLEIANISIDDQERKTRLLTVMGKRCFGINDNKLDCYFTDKNLDSRDVYICYEKFRSDARSHPILHELITHTTNKYEAYPFYCNNGYFVVLKQTNISKRKTFEKIFLVQMDKSEHTKLLTYQTNELKIEFIFNIIGRIYFAEQPLVDKKYEEIETSAEAIIDKRLEDISDGTITNQTFLNNNLFNSLRGKIVEIESAYINFLGRGMEFINEPDNEEIIFLFTSSISDAIKLIENEEIFEEIVSFLEMIKIIVKEKKISYLIKKQDQDIKDIFLFLLETITVWNRALSENDLFSFNRATIDLYNALKYFIDTYFQFYYDYQRIDAQVKVSNENENEELYVSKLVSAKEFFNKTDMDFANLDELIELQAEMESSMFTEMFNDFIKENSQKFLQGYIRLLNNFYEFQNFSYALSLLNEQVDRFNGFDDSTKVMEQFRIIVEDLIEWKNKVFIEQSAENIHYIDDLLYINIAKIDILLEENEDSEDFFSIK